MPDEALEWARYAEEDWQLAVSLKNNPSPRTFSGAGMLFCRRGHSWMIQQACGGKLSVTSSPTLGRLI